MNRKRTGRMLAALAAMASLAYGQPAVPTRSPLPRPVTIPLILNGKQVGTSTLPAGTMVEVVAETDREVVVRHMGQEIRLAKETPAPATATPAEASANEPAPEPAPEPTPEPTATPSEESARMEAAPTPAPSAAKAAPVAVVPPKRWNGFLMSQVALDDAKTNQATHLKEARRVNLTTDSNLAFQAFSRYGEIEFRYQGLEPGARYHIRIEFPAGKTINERFAPFTKDDCRPQSVLCGTETIATLKVGQTSPKTVETDLSPSAYANGELVVKITCSERPDAMVSNITITSNCPKALPQTSTGTAGKETPATEVALESLDGFLAETSWGNPTVSEAWRPLGEVGDEKTFYRGKDFTFCGVPGVFAQMRTKAGRLHRLDIVLAEQSQFETDAVDSDASSARKLQAAQAAAWTETTKTAAQAVNTALVAQYGPGNRIYLDAETKKNPQGEPPTVEFKKAPKKTSLLARDPEGLCVRVTSSPIIFEVTLEAAKDASGSRLRKDALTKEARAARSKASVQDLPNGDRVLRLVGCQQLGPYCAQGTLAMVATALGFETNVFDMAAHSSYRIVPLKDKPGQAARLGSYQWVAGCLGMKMIHVQKSPGFEDIQRLIDGGTPIIIGRFFSYARIEHHRELAKNDPLLEPEPITEEFSKLWPTKERVRDGHVSLITGYNKARRELILSESWGLDYINAERVRVEEIEATEDGYSWLAPLERAGASGRNKAAAIP